MTTTDKYSMLMDYREDSYYKGILVLEIVVLQWVQWVQLKVFLRLLRKWMQF